MIFTATDKTRYVDAGINCLEMTRIAVSYIRAGQERSVGRTTN